MREDRSRTTDAAVPMGPEREARRVARTGSLNDFSSPHRLFADSLHPNVIAHRIQVCTPIWAFVKKTTGKRGILNEINS